MKGVLGGGRKGGWGVGSLGDRGVGRGICMRDMVEVTRVHLEERDQR